MALRLLGVAGDDRRCVRARAFMLARGGITRARIFTKMHLALVGAYGWAGLPSLPPWLMLLPAARAVLDLRPVELGARQHGAADPAVRPQARLRAGARLLDELYAEGRAERALRAAAPADAFERFFNGVDAVLKWPSAPAWCRFARAASRAAERWTVERQEHTGDWGGIIPAMLNAMLALRAIGYDVDDPVVVRGFAAIDAFTHQRRRRVSRPAVHLAGMGHRARRPRARRRRRRRRRSAPLARRRGCSTSRSSHATATGR